MTYFHWFNIFWPSEFMDTLKSATLRIIWSQKGAYMSRFRTPKNLRWPIFIGFIVWSLERSILKGGQNGGQIYVFLLTNDFFVAKNMKIRLITLNKFELEWKCVIFPCFLRFWRSKWRSKLRSKWRSMISDPKFSYQPL